MNRIEDLISRMTLPEKLGQLTMVASGYAVTGPVIVGDSTDSIADGTLGNLLNMVGADHVNEMQRIALGTRLGIPLLIGLDIIHGHRMLFPIPIGETACFDPALWEATAREAAAEAAADGLALTFTPMLDVSRDPRWGRTAEGPGEDPYVGQRLAEAKVRGFQGAGLANAEAIAACAKHYVAYGPVTGGRDYASVDISERQLREIHLPPFEAAVKAGVATIMPAFTDLNGVPMSAHIPLLRDYLRGTLGWEGVLISDYNAIGELIKHGVASDLVEAATLALKAGVDIDMMADAYRKGLPVALERGWVTMDEIDTCVRRVLRLKEQLGLFEDPYRRGATAETPERHANRRELARAVAGASITMLRNHRDVLPLPASPAKLAVLGPLADASAQMCGCWWAAGEHEPHISVMQGLRAALPKTELAYAPGVAIQSDDTDGVEAALALCDGADAVVLCVGEAAVMSGEAACRTSLDLPGQQRVFCEAVLARAATLGIPVVTVLFSGRPLTIDWLAKRTDALLAAWFLGTEAGNAVADVLLGKRSPGGRTPMSWPRSTGQIPVYFGQRPSGRPMNPDDHYTSKYMDSPNEPLYPFGHGLTYGRFTYTGLSVTPDSAGTEDTFTVKVELRNVGAHAAEETVFLFVRDPVASVARPLLELKGFTKIALAPGTSGTAEVSLRAADLAYLDAALQPVLDSGEIEIWAGPCADRAQLMSTRVRIQ